MASTPRATSADPARPSSTVISTSKATPASSATPLEEVELNERQNGSANPPSAPLEGDIMQCARLGEIALLQKMFESGKFTARYKDEEGITPLHVRSREGSCCRAI